MSQQQAISDRVRGLIADSGLTQSDFAARCGLDAPKLSKSLSGVRRFTSLDLARIADVAGVTVDWLLGTEPPTPALAGRAASSGGDSVEVAVRMATAFARARADLADLGYRSHPVHLESSQRGKAVDQGARLAAQAAVIFRSAGCEPTARELAPVVEEVFGIDVAVAELPDGFDGLAWRDDDAELIVVGTSTVPARQRFTIAHELGHLLAGDDQRLHLDPNVMDQDHRRQPSEMRANAFAAAFLMPEDLLAERAAKGDVRAFADLADQLSVSPSTLT